MILTLKTNPKPNPNANPNPNPKSMTMGIGPFCCIVYTSTFCVTCVGHYAPITRNMQCTMRFFSCASTKEKRESVVAAILLS